MPRQQRSVRIDPDLLATLEQLARERAVPVTFAEQVDAGLRLLIAQADDQRLRRSSAKLAADRDRAQATFDQLHNGPR